MYLNYEEVAKIERDELVLQRAGVVKHHPINAKTSR